MEGYADFLKQLLGELSLNPLNAEPLLLYLRDNPSRWASRETPTRSISGVDADSSPHPIIGTDESLQHPALVKQRKGFVTVIEELDVRPSAFDGGPISDLLAELKIALKTGNTKGFGQQNVNRDLQPFSVDAYRCSVFGTIKRQLIVPEGADFLLYHTGLNTGESFKLDVSLVLRREPVELARLIWPHLMRGR
ncbi:hypothetical protein OAU50_03405 [Planctomycetota bacterium]|nr:hypothetical protein [Planctomycetota bacterium]